MRWRCRSPRLRVSSRSELCSACAGDAVMHQEHRKQKERAFTLIELLIVVAIIAVLAAVAAGLYQRVQKQKTQLESAARLRQWGAALGGYIADNDGALP